MSAGSGPSGGLLRPPGFQGAIFGDAAHGDVRRSSEAVERFAAVGVPRDIAYANQVHGVSVLEASAPGLAGDGDAIVTTTPGLAVTVATADCVPIIVEGDGFAAVIHAGWRGAAAGVVAATMRHLTANGLTPLRAAIGPAIGPCCYEVGADVLEAIPEHAGRTDWGTPSVDLAGSAAAALGDIPVWMSRRCTMHDEAYFSWRRDRSEGRQVALAWLPSS